MNTSLQADEAAYRAWFQEAWSRIGSHAPANRFDECCPVSWLLPDLLELIARTRHEPITAVRTRIRALLAQSSFNDIAGDPVIDARRLESIAAYTDLLTRAAEQVRRRARDLGPTTGVAEPSHFFG